MITNFDLLVGTASYADGDDGIIILELGDGSRAIDNCDCLETRNEYGSEMSYANYFPSVPILLPEM